jgi:WD40 repeat protein
MPQTSDAIIVSGAGDSEVRIFDLHNTGQKLDSMYVCHSDQLKKVCVYHDNPFEFLTCSQDGKVKQKAHTLCL